MHLFSREEGGGGGRGATALENECMLVFEGVSRKVVVAKQKPVG
jgi:hypothetical protein